KCKTLLRNIVFLCPASMCRSLHFKAFPQLSSSNQNVHRNWMADSRVSIEENQIQRNDRPIMSEVSESSPHVCVIMCVFCLGNSKSSSLLFYTITISIAALVKTKEKITFANP
uniref:Uncharacterized protein n=1 Tax=Cyprinus carpio TaxID=7962 RepID=A0A8C1G853_CYPCA